MDGSRRVFMLRVAVAGSTLAALRGFAQSGDKLDEKDPQAVAVGYVTDSTRADEKKFPQHTNDQMCANCRHYHGKAGDAMGGCDISGKQVAEKGWCKNWEKNAG